MLIPKVKQNANVFPGRPSLVICLPSQLDLQPDRRSFVDRRSPIEPRSSLDRMSAPLRRS
jgi:hypothetical protein